MDLLFNAVVFLGVLFVLVVVHELGHFLTAKRAGVTVLEFGIGYPPRLFGFRRGETEYTFNLLPLGGFVRMVGEEDPTEPGSLASKSIPWRLAVLSAGVIMNAILAFVLFGISAALPHTETVGQVVINGVKPGSPAEQAGIRPDDSIVSLNGKPVKSLQDLTYLVNLNLGNQIALGLSRDGREYEAVVTPRFAPPPGEGATGIEIGMANPIWRYRKEKGLTADDIARQVGVPLEVARAWISNGSEAVGRTRPEEALANERGVTTDALREQHLQKLGQVLGISQEQLTERYVRREQVSLSPVEAVPAGIRRSFEMIVLFKNEMTGLVARRSAPQVTGPAGIAALTGQVAQQATQSGISVLLDWMALLSINLAVVNALPIPMLDGGRILFVLIELVRGGRRIAPDKEKFAHLIGAAFLFTLIIAITFQDIVRLATGEAIFR